MPYHRSEEHTSELQSHDNLVCRLLLEKKKTTLPPRSSHTPANPHQPTHHPRPHTPSSGIRTVPQLVPLRRIRRERMSVFFFNDAPTPEIYPLSLPDALPI